MTLRMEEERSGAASPPISGAGHLLVKITSTS